MSKRSMTQVEHQHESPSKKRATRLFNSDKDESGRIDIERRPMNPLQEPVAHLRPALEVFVFGNGDMGQLGLGTDFLQEISRPRRHVWFESAVKSGILGPDNGNNIEGAGVEKVYAGGMHTLVVDEAGRVWSWGVNDNASLGRPTTNVPDPDSPDQILEQEILESQPMVVQELVQQSFRAVDVIAGDSVSVALGLQGDLRVWGSFRASDGLLGFDGMPGSPEMQFSPISLPSLRNVQFVQVACGTDHVVALSTMGTVYVWGNGQQAQLGRRIIERRKINGLSPERLALRRIKLIGTGNYHSFAVSETGVVYAWGLNSMRQTGVSDESVGTEDIIWQPTEVAALNPQKLGNGKRVVQISGGEHHTLFLLSDGSVYGCGRCDGFELGLADDHPAIVAMRTESTQDSQEEPLSPVKPTNDYVPEPVLIPFPPPPTAEDENPTLTPYSEEQIAHLPVNPIARISAGTRHNLAVSRAGHLYSWGFGNSCQLGLGASVESQPVPIRVRSKALEGWTVVDASAGGQHCVVLARRQQFG